MVGPNDPVPKGGAVLVSSSLEDIDAWGIGGSNVCIDLVKGGVFETELGERLNHDCAITLSAIFIGNNKPHGCSAIDWVVVVQLDASNWGVGSVIWVGIEFEFSRGQGGIGEGFQLHIDDG